jgi:hypothetical protein
MPSLGQLYADRSSLSRENSGQKYSDHVPFALRVA